MLSRRLPLIQEADLAGKVVIVRFDHNVVRGGVIGDAYRIDQSLGTLYYIVERGGRPVIMSHIGRPRNRKTGIITCGPDTSVEPVVEYLERKLHVDLFIPEFAMSAEDGIAGIDDSIYTAVEDLKNRSIGGIYLPNTRWFRGEEGEGFFREGFAVKLAGIADVFINDAFGSWQPHVSTYDVTRYIPSYAGFLMQQEMENLTRLLHPERPFLAVIAGAKYDTKIGPLYAIYSKAENLILGGVIYNAFLCAKYGISIRGVQEEDVSAAKELVEMDSEKGKIVELPYVVESETMQGRQKGKYRTLSVSDFREGESYSYILDIDPRSLEDKKVLDVIMSARTIFVNAVLGFTPHFTDGSEALGWAVARNRDSYRMYGGGDTLQELRNLCPGLYLSALDHSQYYFFTGGGAVLTAISEGSPYGLKPVQALIENKERFETNGRAKDIIEEEGW
jgi:phosphoglycerate kinase